jgi:hypothetical protein
MELLAKSVRSEPRGIRAARRASFPAVRMRRPRAGYYHPASATDVRNALEIFGPETYYGVHSVELVPGPPARSRLLLGQLVGPGEIVLYDQARSPWRLGFALAKADGARLEAAGADLSEQGIVSWPGDSLRRFMLGHVLAHELGHHVLQHERRLRGERAARTREHEARAEAIAARLRLLLD